MPRKKQKATYTSDEPPEPPHACHVSDCEQPGIYKAPRSRDSLRDYDWYCIDHIRAYNQKWDYFSGMERDQIEDFMRDAVTGHRPTWRREENLADSYEKLQAALNDFLNISPRQKKTPRADFRLPKKLREALALFDMDYPYTEKQLKARYRALVKKFHPDANKGARDAEEKFKEITVAYLFMAKELKDD